MVFLTFLTHVATVVMFLHIRLINHKKIPSCTPPCMMLEIDWN